MEHEPLDGRSDLWALCCVLVEMLRAEPPFGRYVHQATLRAIAEVTPRDVDVATRGLSEKVRAICQKALARDPAQRFATGHEMAQALLAQHECRGPSAVRKYIAALEALPEMKREDVEKLAADLRRVRRNRRALIALGGLVLAVATAFFGWSASRFTPPGPAAPPPVAAAPLEQLITPIPAPVHNVVVTPPSDPAPGEHSALPAVVSTKKARIPSAVPAQPTERRGDEAVNLSADSDKSMGPLRDELVTAKTSFEAMAAKYVKASGEALSPQHAWATLLATGNGNVTGFHEVSFRRLTVNGVNVDSTVWMNDASGTVAVVVDLPNPNDAAPWEPLEGRIISNVRSSSESPVALRAMPRVIPPGQRGRVALVFNRSVIQDKAMVEILRDSRPDFGIEVTSQELAQRNSPWRSLWPFGER